ncbi:Lrp/AsnC family transcriptional regulator [archaeon]|nr:MAG: Lrp/AsnC family transcriptional regulator [archaeon]
MDAIKLDVKDRKILFELEKDARQSNKSIARKVGLNTDLVRYRIDRLKREGVISWFLTFVNFAKLGLTDYGVYFTTQKLTRKREDEMINYLTNHKQVSYFSKLGGKYDFMIGILAKDVLQFNDILSEITDKLGAYISSKDIAIRIVLFHFSKNYLVGTKEMKGELPHFGGKVETVELDELDRKILNRISTDARLDIIDLARELNTPSSTIALRIKKMREKKVIEGFFTWINSQSYGFQNYELMLALKNMSKTEENKFYGFCKQHPNIVYAMKTVGKWDYELGIEVPNQERYQEVLSEIRENFSEFITNMEFVTIFKHIKYNLYPF